MLRNRLTKQERKTAKNDKKNRATRRALKRAYNYK